MSVTLLDCTLRDGSYALDFQFSSQFTLEYCQVVDELGFKYIEVGHGMGIGASDKIRRALATDFQYAEAAEKAKTNSKWGMFAQPAFSKMKDIDRLINIGMDFIRVGVDINDIDSGLNYIKELCEKKVEVFVNLMKSYVVPPEKLVNIMQEFVNLGIAGIYLVDSAGGMLRNEILDYAIKLKPLSGKTKLGFHGHDNLGLAVSNSLLLTEMGFTLIDCTMQGMGRSSGNASTEKLVAALKRSGLENSLDLIKLLKAGENLIRPKLPNAGHSGLDTFAGYTFLQICYMDYLLCGARQVGVDPYTLMQEHCSIDLVSGSTIDLTISANKLLSQGIRIDTPFPSDRYIGNEQS